MKNYEIISCVSCSTLKEFCLEVMAEKGVHLGEIQWKFLDETAVGYALGSISRLTYSFFPKSIRVSPFSGVKVNQILMFISDSKEELWVESCYIRTCRRLKDKNLRMELFGIEDESMLSQKMQILWESKAFSGILKERFAFSFVAHEKTHQESFIEICREYHVSRFRSLLVFPQSLAEEEDLLDQESILFQGELEEAQVPEFLQAMSEERLNIREISFYSCLRLSDSGQDLSFEKKF